MPRTATKRASTASRRTTSARSRPAQKRTTRQRDVIALLKADHAAGTQLFRRYQSLSERALKSRRQVAERVIKELSIHAAVEEQILYPNVRVAVPNGKSLVTEAIDEHQSVKEALAALDKCAPDSAEFDELMTRIRDEVRHHVKEEESRDGILGQLRKHASREELVEMAKMTRAAKKMAPTRPHPNAPSTPPGNVVVGLAAAVVDKARDTIAGRKS